MWRKENPMHYCWKYKKGIVTMNNSMEFPPNIKIDLPYDLAISLLGLNLL